MRTHWHISKLFLAMLAIFIVSLGCSSKIEREKFRKMYLSAKEIDNALSEKVNYLRYEELFKNFSNEISAAKDEIKSDAGRKLLDAYLELFSTYKDGYSLWEYRIASTAYGWIPEGRIYLEPGIKYIAEKYNLPKEQHYIKLTQHHFETVPADSIEVIWDRAHDQFKKIRRLNLKHFICP